MNYEIKRNGYVIADVRPIGEQKKSIMAENVVDFTFDSSYPIHLQIGDYIDVWGERYELNSEPDALKESTYEYSYSMQFQAAHYKLMKPKFRFYDASNRLTLKQFELSGTLEDFLDLVIDNANRTQTGWIKGDFESTEVKLLPFNGENILNAINQIAEAFNTEWWIINKVIHFIKKGSSSGQSFEYGYDKGLDGGIKRNNNDSSNVFSRLYVYGSDKNIPVDYRGGLKNLTLPAPMEFIQGPLWGKEEIEHDISFDDIKPERIGTVTSIGDIYTFSDSGLDFDINAQTFKDTNGTVMISPKVSFLTGNLAGYNFDIAKGGYDHSTKTIKIVKSDLEKSFPMPSDDFHPSVGDTYFLFDLKMPDSYVLEKEHELLTKGQEYFDKFSRPLFSYTIPTDNFFFDDNNITLGLGDTIHVKDLDLLLNRDIRIISYSRDLHYEFTYTAMDVSDVVLSSNISRPYVEAQKRNKALELNKIFDIQRSRNNWKTTNEVASMLETIKAEMLLIKIDGGSFQTTITASATPAAFVTTTGQIVQDEYLGATDGIWKVPASNTPIVADGPQYAYIKASKTGTGAEIVISTTRIGVEDVAAFYHFPFVIVSSIIDGGRSVTKVYGRSSVTGGQIATGEIVSNNGLSSINLDNGTFDFINELARIAFTDQGVVLEGKIIATTAEFVNLFVQNLRTKPTGKAVKISSDSNNIQILNESEQVFIEADDDSAIEGTYWNRTPPLVLQPGNVYPKNYLGSFNDATDQFRYYYATMGPGISAGISPTDADGYSTMGRKGFFTNGKFRVANASGTQETTVDQLGIKTTGLIDVSGNALFKGDVNVIGRTSTNGVPYIDFQGDVRMGGGDFYRMTWRNGGLISAVQNPN